MCIYILHPSPSLFFSVLFSPDSLSSFLSFLLKIYTTRSDRKGKEGGGAGKGERERKRDQKSPLLSLYIKVFPVFFIIIFYVPFSSLF